jgi:hypothetical protein
MAVDSPSFKIVDWTILPAKVTARAWIDGDFKADLLSEPDAVLSREVREWPDGLTFSIHEDQPGKRNLPLPELKDELKTWDEDRLKEQVGAETVEDDSLEYQLPPRVILRALSDETYRQHLLDSPRQALEEVEIQVSDDVTFTIHQNEGTRYHLALPVSPTAAADLRYEELRGELEESFGFATSQCCASGTCT